MIHLVTLIVAGFQTISNEENMYNQKMGDFGGYCLAWCLWYIELRLKNLKANPKVLVRKTLNKLMDIKLKPDEYIRRPLQDPLVTGID